jgi:hypothetical protein
MEFKLLLSHILAVTFVTSNLEGDDIPISKFLDNEMIGGVMLPGTTRSEKRRPNPSALIPKWNASACTQCNQW